MGERVAVTIELEVVDPKILSAYTSGFMPKDATIAQRARELIVKHHPIHPDLTGVSVRSAGGPDQDDVVAVDAVEHYGVEVTIGHSAGSDGATIVIIDTINEPDASDGGPGLRVMVNDGDVYEGIPWLPLEDDDG